MKCWAGRGGADLLTPHWKLRAFSTEGLGASEQCEHGGNTGRLLCSVRHSGGMVEDGFEGDKTRR